MNQHPLFKRFKQGSELSNLGAGVVIQNRNS